MILDRLSLYIGKRTIKTAISVFITAVICVLLKWPVIFAVLAAIVTIEPSVNESIQKAKTRLPAAVVGSAFAMTFGWLIGHTPLSYALSVLFTIAVCHRLRWEDAIVVAALTSLNMLVLTEDHFLKNFFIRIGTTSLGIIVSVIVNYFVFPPYFAEIIKENKPKLFNKAYHLLHEVLQWHLNHSGKKEPLKKQFAKLDHQTDQLYRLVDFQFEEFRYHKFRLKQYREMAKLKKDLERLQQLNFHIGRLVYLNKNDSRAFDEEERHVIWRMFEQLGLYFNDQNESHAPELLDNINYLKRCLQDQFAEGGLLSYKNVIALELLSICGLLVNNKEVETLIKENVHI